MTSINPIKSLGDSTKRRGFLFLIASLMASGCLNNKDTIYPLNRVIVSNDTDSDVSAEISFRKDGEPVDELETEIPAREDTVIKKEWMGDAVNYDITVSLAQNGKKSVSTSDLSERYNLQEDDCIAVDFEVNPNNEIETFLTGESCDN